MITLQLSDREADALARNLEFSRDVLGTMGVRGTLHELGFAPGETPLKIAHSKLLAALEQGEGELVYLPGCTPGPGRAA